MALRIAARRSSALRNSSYGLRASKRKLDRRNASAMAVPVSSQEEMTGNDIAVSKREHFTMDSRVLMIG